MEILEKREGKVVFTASYLRRVAYSTLVDEIRRRRRRRESPLEEPDGNARDPISPAPSPHATAEGRRISESIHGCLQGLLEDRRRAVTLHLQGHSVPQAAEILGWKPKRTENLVYRGLADLRQCLTTKGLNP